MWWRPTIGIMIQVQSLHQLLNTWKGYKSVSVQRLVAMFLFKSEATESSFSIPQKHIPTSSCRISKKPLQAPKKKGGGNLHFTQPPKKIPPISANLTSSKDGCYSFEALRSWSWYNLPRHYCPNSVEPQGWWRVGDADLEFFLEESCEIRCEYVIWRGWRFMIWHIAQNLDVYDIHVVICWYGIGAVLVFCSSLALLKIKGLLVWRLKEDVVLLLIIRTCAVQVWRGNF